MPAILISVVVFFVVATGITYLGYQYLVRPVRLQARLGAAVIEAPTPEQIGQYDQPHKAWAVRIIQTIGEKVPISPADAGVTRRYLLAAGFRSDFSIRVFYGIKVLVCAAFLATAVYLALGGYIGNMVLKVVAVAAGFALGWYAPTFGLEMMIDRRQERIKFSLPDALDLMVVCMEAGLGLDQAIANVARELRSTHKDISEELGLVTLEMRAGKRRAEALKNLADRAGEPDLRKLVATMIQADRFGTSVADSLRTHSDYMRVRRRQDAEERAGKVGVKLVFPIFFCVLPSILLTAAGPGLLKLFKELFPLMASFGK